MLVKIQLTTMNFMMRCVMFSFLVNACAARRIATQHEASKEGKLNAGLNSSHQALLEEAVQQCVCWDPFTSLTLEECCIRTDKGSKHWTGLDTYSCRGHDNIQNKPYECDSYCFINCYRVPHEDDDAGVIGYAAEKLAEANNLPEDILLARASWQAQQLAKSQKQMSISVSRIHQLHPVGSWREVTYAKTERRRDAILKSKSIIHSRGNILTEHDMQNENDLGPMRSVTPFVAVPFPFCGNGYVLLEGNGRVKGMQMAMAKDPTLNGMKVEATVLQFTRENMRTVHEGIALLWNQYVNTVETLDAEKDALQIQEYSTFKVGVFKCNGVYKSMWESRAPCPIVDDSLTQVGEVPVGDLFGANEIMMESEENYRYRLCEGFDPRWLDVDPAHVDPAHLSLLSQDSSVVTEFCPNCVSKNQLYRF